MTANEALKQCLVIVPTYNEAENIRAIIEATLSQGAIFDILVIDDGSPDGTADVVEKCRMDHPGRIHLMQRKTKTGLGTAYLAGFGWGLNQGYQYLFEMDADFSHPPEDLNRLYHACNNSFYDVSVGSRYVKGGKIENWPLDRIMLSYGASLYVRLLTWMPVKDPTAGFICYKREVLEALDLSKIEFVGYAFQIEMKYAVRSLGFRIKEIPITFKDRVLGQSKITKGIVKEAVFGVLKMALFGPFKNYGK
jgi:dolichol-phosphate mannosyltransferase